MKIEPEHEYIGTNLQVAEIQTLGNPCVKLSDGRIVAGTFDVIDENEHGKAIVILYLIPGDTREFKLITAEASDKSGKSIKKPGFEAWLKARQHPIKRCEFEAWLKDHKFIFFK